MQTEILIHSTIEEADAERVRRILAKARGEIHLRVNSEGGDLDSALTIYDLLKAHLGRVVAHVEGVALSAASLVAMAGDEIETAPDSTWMIHAPLLVGEIAADASGLRSTATVLDGLGVRMAMIYAERTRQPVAQIQRWLAAETWFAPEEAVRAGLADRVGPSLRVAARARRPVDLANFRRNPGGSFEGLVARFRASGLTHMKARARVAREHPEVHRAYIDQANAGRRRR